MADKDVSTEIAGLPYWDLTFDADGDADPKQADAFSTGILDRGITDVIVFSHGWGATPQDSHRLYQGFFGLLAGQLQNLPADQHKVVGLAGVVWPARLWPDQPIPDFPSQPLAGDHGGAASVAERGPVSPATSDPTLDAATLTSLQELFPAAAGPLATMASLLEKPPTQEAQAEFFQQMKKFSQLAGPGGDDGERGPAGGKGSQVPGMLQGDDPAALFTLYRDKLMETGAPVSGGAGIGTAGLGDALHGLWDGAKEALRQLTYYQMKHRAGIVGQNGLGKLIGKVHLAAPAVRVHLVGHSFGARLVSFALAGLPADLSPSPVKAVTLLEGAFSHFAFAVPLPFDAGRNGALGGMLARIDGPLTVCFSTHDSAVGTLYPLASIASHEDAAAAENPLYRWGAMGADGAQGVGATLVSIRPAGPGTSYPFATGQALNIDSSEIVRAGGPPAGAHSDIVHPELSWIVLKAGGILP